jgi:hypothetical protein
MKNFNMSTQRIHSPTMAVLLVDDMEDMEKGVRETNLKKTEIILIFKI